MWSSRPERAVDAGSRADSGTIVQIVIQAPKLVRLFLRVCFVIFEVWPHQFVSWWPFSKMSAKKQISHLNFGISNSDSNSKFSEIAP